MAKKGWKWLGAAAAVLVTGCLGEGSGSISGVVSTRPGLADSCLWSHVSTGGELLPVGGARVGIAYDAQGADRVPGYEVVSDSAGAYRIELGRLPAPRARGGDYYLVVEKAGYDPLIAPVRVGPLSLTEQNTVLLKQRVEAQ